MRTCLTEFLQCFNYFILFDTHTYKRKIDLSEFYNAFLNRFRLSHGMGPNGGDAKGDSGVTQ